MSSLCFFPEAQRFNLQGTHIETECQMHEYNLGLHKFKSMAKVFECITSDRRQTLIFEDHLKELSTFPPIVTNITMAFSTFSGRN